MGVYLHLMRHSVLVAEGQRVQVGTPLARSGNTGNSSGPHLHFVIQRNVGLALESIPLRLRPAGRQPAELRHRPRALKSRRRRGGAGSSQSSLTTLARTIFGPRIFFTMIRRPSVSRTSSSSGTRFRVS